MNIRGIIAAGSILFAGASLQGQVNSPDLRCLFVQANGDVTLTWVPPSDPNNEFVSYQVFTNTVSGPGFTPITSILSYATTSYVHAGAGANSQPIYYYIITEYNFNGNFYSTPLDTFSTIYMNVTNPGSPYGTLNYSQIHNPLPSTNSGNYTIYADYPLANTFTGSTNALTYLDTEIVCNRNIDFYVENPDASGCVSRSNVDGAIFKDNIIPSTPVVDSVSVDPATNNAELGWNVSVDGDVTAYVIYQYISGFWVPIDTVYGHFSTSYINANSNADVNSEMYCMAALDSCGNISPLGNNQNTIFANVTIDKCLATATITWNNYVNWPTGVTGFTVFASYNAGPFNAVGSVGPNTFSFTQTGLMNGNYCYFVRAYGNNGLTSSSQKLCMPVVLAVLPTFTYITTATVNTPFEVQVNTYVDLAASVEAYRLERADNAGGPYTVIATVPYTGSPVITLLDNTALTNVQSYFYHVISIDSCGHDAQTSVFSQTIHLSTIPNSDRTNTLNWNNYSGWLAGVGSYDIYRSIDGGPFIPIANVNFPSNTYLDDVDPFYPSSGKFTYYVEGHEAAMNGYNFQENSLSNKSDC